MDTDVKELQWIKACTIHDVPLDGGACIKYNDEQIAIFNFARQGTWYATQNLCPHKMQMALSRGMIGESKGEPKVACPFHKKTFSLTTGECLDGDVCAIRTYPVKIVGEAVMIGIE